MPNMVYIPKPPEAALQGDGYTMENTNTIVEQKLLKGMARIMSDLAERYDFAHADHPRRIHEQGTDEGAGELMTGMVILELQQCRTFPLEHIERSLKQIRTSFSRYFHSSEFRRSVKLYGQLWSILEERRQDRDGEYPWLMHTVDYLLNQLMSLAGIENDLSRVNIHGQILNISSWRDSGALEQFHRRLPQFVGLLDYLEANTLESVLNLFPRTLIAPDWYDNSEFDGESVDDDMALYEAISKAFPVLQRPHVIRSLEGPIKSITVLELTESENGLNSVRCLIAVPTFEGTDGSDIYLATLGRGFSGSGLLVGNHIPDPGAQVLYAVYKALGQAIEDETGDTVDIDALLARLDEAETEEV